jgi:ABC-2 type transport system ATP-binding protein
MIKVENLVKAFGAKLAVNDVSFTVERGEVLGFLGPNGAGKSTTMRIVLGVLAPDSGQVRLSGQPIDFTSRRTIGYMPEERGLYPKMKVGDQLSYLAQLHGLSAAQAKASVDKWTERLGVAARKGDAVQTLSLGNQQRVQLAAALVHDPAVLVLDEPFSGLDPVAVDVMSAVLKEKAASGVPVVFSSHQLELVQRLSDRVGIIVKGRMRTVGTVDELRSQGNRRLEIVAPQARPEWADTVTGVRVVESEGGRFLLELDPQTDDQQVLRAALATGPVHHFASSKPSLTELYREVVAA